jgi:hypothetical protein
MKSYENMLIWGGGGGSENEWKNMFCGGEIWNCVEYFETEQMVAGGVIGSPRE